MLTAIVWILAGLTAWCVASLTLALVVGPMIRAARRPGIRPGGLPVRRSLPPRAPQEIPAIVEHRRAA